MKISVHSTRTNNKLTVEHSATFWLGKVLFHLCICCSNELRSNEQSIKVKDQWRKNFCMMQTLYKRVACSPTVSSTFPTLILLSGRVGEDDKNFKTLSMLEHWSEIHNTYVRQLYRDKQYQRKKICFKTKPL